MNHEKLTLILRDYTTCAENCFVAIWSGFGWNFQDEYSELFEEMIDFDKIAGKCGIYVRRMRDLSSPSWVIPHLPGKRIIKSEPRSYCRNFELSLVDYSAQPMRD